MNDDKNTDEQPEDGTDVSAASDEVVAETPEPGASPASETTEEPKATRSWVPTTAAGKSRLVAAGIAGAFFLGGGLGGYAIGQANDGPDRPGLTRPDFDSQRGPGGAPGRGPGQQVQPDQQQGGTSSSGVAS